MELDEKNIIEELSNADHLIRRIKKYINDENRNEVLKILNTVVDNAMSLIEQESKEAIESFEKKCW